MVEQDDKINPADLRVSHAEREHVLGLLQEAMEQGMLNTQEFDERSARVVGAQTRAELNALVTDLPVRATAEIDDGIGPSAGADNVVELRGSFSSIKRRGNWVVPRKMVLRCRMGSVDLDFTQARIDHEVVEIQLDIGGGSVELRLPEGASASTDGVSVTMGSMEDHRRDVSPEGLPRFVVTGEVRWGSAEIRGPRRWPFGSR